MSEQSIIDNVVHSHATNGNSATRNVLVLMGGMSSEHEVSLNSGTRVVEGFDRTRYTVTPAVIGKDGRWSFDGAPAVSIYDAVTRIRDLNIDCVFNAIHGEYGEDGRLQGFLDLLELPYTGSGCAASALAMDKVRSKAVVAAQGIRIAGHVALDRATWLVDPAAVVEAVDKDLGLPCVVKPSNLGSSVGMSIPKDIHALEQAIDTVFKASDYIMIEQFVPGTEVTCAVLDTDPSGRVHALPVTEIRPRKGDFFDYHCKYTPGATEEITPAEISAELTSQVQEISVHVHEIMGCSIWSRSDFIIGPEGPIWLEVNTVPGLTQTSLYPQAAAAAGISYSTMLELFVETAIRESAWRKGKS